MSTTYVCPLSDLEQVIAATRSRHVISLLGEESLPVEVAGINRVTNHLYLQFHDVPYDINGLISPNKSHIHQIMAFVKTIGQDEPIVVHCWAGISRSTAAGYIITAALNPQVDEFRLAKTLRKLSPTATPNSLMIACADEVLERKGRMREAIAGIGQGAFAVQGKPFCLDPGVKQTIDLNID